jgi:hypothetical protein
MARRTSFLAAANPPAAPPRTRSIAAPNSRAVAGHNSAAVVTEGMKTLAREFYLANSIANAAAAKAKKARASLLREMKENKVTEFEVEIKDDGKTILADAKVETPDATYIDVNLLKKLVKPDLFMKIISATKASVENHAGTSIALQCEAVKPGTENVGVKARK